MIDLVLQSKRRGRKRGSKNKLSPEITRKIGDATLYYASGDYDEVRFLVKQIYYRLFWLTL